MEQGLSHCFEILVMMKKNAWKVMTIITSVILEFRPQKVGEVGEGRTVSIIPQCFHNVHLL